MTVKIGPFRYSVVVDEHIPLGQKEEIAGCIVTKDQRIWVNSKQGDDQMADTVLHEVLHGCWFLSGNGEGDADEKFIQRVSGVLLGVLRDNPELVTYLVGG